MDEHNYYFVFYKCKRYGWKPDGTSTGHHISELQELLIDTHPLRFQLECNEKYGHQHDAGGGYTSKEEYLVVNWKRITKEEYDQFNGCVG